MILKMFFYVLSPVLALETCITGTSNGIKQQPRHIFVNSGGTAVINCTVTNTKTITGINLRKRFTRIMFINNSNNYTSEINYEDRLTCSGLVTNFSVTLRNLTEDDSDLYLCDGAAGNSQEIYGEGTLIIVHAPFEKEVKKEENAVDTAIGNSRQFAYVPYIITIFILFILLVLSLVFIKFKMSQKKQSLNQNTYVDMTQTLRRNTMGNSFMYTKPPNTATTC